MNYTVHPPALAMSESQQKKRHRARRPPDETLIERVTAFLSGRPGIALETHMAGMWNELGFRLDVPSDFTDGDVLALGNALLDLIRTAAAELEIPFTWIAGIYRAGELVRVLDPRSEPMRICGICGETQWASFGDVCLSCRSAMVP